MDIRKATDRATYTTRYRDTLKNRLNDSLITCIQTSTFMAWYLSRVFTKRETFNIYIHIDRVTLVYVLGIYLDTGIHT